MYSQSVPVQTTHDFLKQQRTMNFQNYLQQKREEKIAVKRYHAAVKIQAAFRGWLVRCNFKLIQAAAIKMQALWRRALVRKVYTVLLEERREKRYQEMLNKAATKIQAAWRGYESRKNRFNFKTYKELQLKNLALQASIDRINELEEAISDISHISDEEEQIESITSIIASSNDSSMSSLNAKSKSLNKTLTGSMEELSTMSPTRIAELLTHAIESSNGSIPRSNSLRKKSSRGGKFRSDRSANIEQQLSKELMEVRDSILDMFPEMPSSVNLVRPDQDQVELLQRAIRLLRQNIQQRELNKMAKVHYLMRTAVIPGVYSDIYSNELTEIEKQFKSLKFWKHDSKGCPAALRSQSQTGLEKFVSESEQETKRLFSGKSRISNGPFSRGSGSKLSQGGGDLHFDPNNTYTSDEYTDFYAVKPGRHSSVAMTTPPTTGPFSEISDSFY